MRRLCLAILFLCGLVIMVASSGPAEAYTAFKKPLQQRYGYRSVSCFTCHEKGKDENGKPLGKEFLNELGKEMKKLFVESNFAERLDEAEKADAETSEDGKTSEDAVASEDGETNEDAEANEDGEKKGGATKKKVNEEISKEFLQALEKFETMKSPSGDPWGELFKAGKIEGVKIRKQKKAT